MQREHRDDLVAVDHGAACVHGEHPVAVAVECHAEVEPVADDDLLQRPQVGRAAADVDVVPVWLVPDRRHLSAELLERLWCETGIGAVRAVDADT